MNLLPVIRALQFDRPCGAGLEALPAAQWPALLHAVDRHRLTVPLALRCSHLLPAAILARMEQNLAATADKHLRLIAAHREILNVFEQRKIDFIVLKGLSNSPYYTAHPKYRQQYDIDIFCPAHSLGSACQSVQSLGYEPLQTAVNERTDHLPRMIRKTGWIWRHDYYDPAMPPAVELHFQFWDEWTERFGVGDLEPFWNRRVVRNIEGLTLPALCPADGLTYSALHLVRHLLRGDLQLHHVYEIAHFLEHSARDEAFWAEWRRLTSANCLPAAGIAFRLATDWFHCRPHAAAREAAAQLPAPVKRWFHLFALTPALATAHANKNELWLNLCLVRSNKDRLAVCVRRLFPFSRGRVLLNPHIPAADADFLTRLKGVAFEVSFLARRAVHHFCAAMLLARSGLAWLFR